MFHRFFLAGKKNIAYCEAGRQPHWRLIEQAAR